MLSQETSFLASSQIILLPNILSLWEFSAFHMALWEKGTSSLFYKLNSLLHTNPLNSVPSPFLLNLLPSASMDMQINTLQPCAHSDCFEILLVQIFVVFSVVAIIVFYRLHGQAAQILSIVCVHKNAGCLHIPRSFPFKVNIHSYV